MNGHTEGDFERATKQDKPSVISDFWYLVQSTGKWWLIPILGLLFLFGGLMLLGGTAAAPFIYTLF